MAERGSKGTLVRAAPYATVILTYGDSRFTALPLRPARKHASGLIYTDESCVSPVKRAIESYAAGRVARSTSFAKTKITRAALSPLPRAPSAAPPLRLE